MELPYLVALALIKEDDKRIMPIGGKSLKEKIEANDSLNLYGKDIALDLLLRIIQRGQGKTIKRYADDKSILIVQISMEKMNSYLPKLKSEWILTGDTNRFINSLIRVSEGLWTITYVKHEGVKFESVV